MSLNWFNSSLSVHSPIERRNRSNQWLWHRVRSLQFESSRNFDASKRKEFVQSVVWIEIDELEVKFDCRFDDNRSSFVLLMDHRRMTKRVLMKRRSIAMIPCVRNDRDEHWNSSDFLPDWTWWSVESDWKREYSDRMENHWMTRSNSLPIDWDQFPFWRRKIQRFSFLCPFAIDRFTREELRKIVRDWFYPFEVDRFARNIW